MKNASGINIIPQNDDERLGSLWHYRILDSPSEQAFDNIIALACQMFDMPAGLISFVDKDRVFFKASYGPGGVTYFERENNICSLVVLDENVVVVENAANDERVKTNPAVQGPAHIRFYAGAPLITSDGYTLGTICVIDVEPRSFVAKDKELLKSLAQLVMERIEYRLADIEKGERRQTIQRLNDELTDTNTKLTNAISHLAKANYELEESQQLQNSLVEQLRLSETRLLQAMESGNMGTWSINKETGKVQLSARSRQLFGFAPDKEIFISDIIETIKPECRHSVTEVLQNVLTHSQDIDSSFPITHVVTQERRWVRTTGKVFYDASGKAINYSGMLMDITEQKQDEERKNDFIGMVSHELKTPLTSVSGYIELLQMDAETNANPFTINALNKAYVQVWKMTTMINSFLNLSRLESGKIEINKTSFVLDDLVKEVIEEASIVPSRHRIHFSMCNPITVHADKDKIENVITNLLSNAIKYSPAGTDVEIDCRTTGSTAQISVKDYGIGIRPDDIEKLFERYYRVKGNTNISGFGIGLYLSAEIIELHNGKIWVESEPGKGSTFYFNLPLK